MKKLLLGLGAVTSIVSPVILIIACSSSKNIEPPKEKTPMSRIVPSNNSSVKIETSSGDGITSSVNVPMEKIGLAIKTPINKKIGLKTKTVPIIKVPMEKIGLPIIPWMRIKTDPIIEIFQMAKISDIVKKINMKVETPKEDKSKLFDKITTDLEATYGAVPQVLFHTGGLHILDTSKIQKNLFIKGRTEPVTYKHVVLNQRALDLSKSIREVMNANRDIQWHTYGDSILDGINAVRLAIHNSLNGDNTLRNKLKEFTSLGLKDYRKLNPFDTKFKIESKQQINGWFDGTNDLTIVRSAGWKPIENIYKAKAITPGYSKFEDSSIIPMFLKYKETLTKNYGALTLGTPEIETAQHRVQEDDWLGSFDGHDHGGTINKIKNDVKTYGDHPTGEFAKAPTGDEGYMGENYMFPYVYNNHKFEEGSDFTSGLLSAINVLYDSDDGSATTGHRTNYYSESLTTFGWSRHASNYGKANWNNFQYLLTQSGSESVSGRPTSRLDEVMKNNPFLNIYSQAALKSLSIIDFIDKFNVNDEFTGKYTNAPYSIRHINGLDPQDMVDQFFKPHNSFEELNADISKVETSLGYADWIDLKQPDHYLDIPRFARPQMVGKPDTWIKTYDYNGGGTITGSQYGYSPIDKTLFE